MGKRIAVVLLGWVCALGACSKDDDAMHPPKTDGGAAGSSTHDDSGGSSGEPNPTNGGRPSGGAESGGSGGLGGAGEEGLEATRYGTFGSGTRLRARYDDAGDGAKVFLGFFDSKLQADCMFLDRGDGKYFCYPSLGFGYQYADEDCSLPLLRAGTGQEGQWRTAGVGADCDSLVVVYELGEKVEPEDADNYVVTSSGECRSTGGGGWDQHALVPVDDAEFVAAEREVFGKGPGLRAVRLTAEDGAYLNTGLVDSRDRPCEEFLVDGVERCVPLPVPRIDANGGRYFTNDTCTEQNAAVFQFAGYLECRDRDPAYVTRRAPPTDEGCFVGNELYLAAERLSDDSGIWLGASCEPASESDVFSGQEYWSFGERSSGEELDRVQTVLVGEGDLKVEFVTDAEGTPLLHRPSLDTWTTGEDECEVVVVKNGTRRCLPRTRWHLDLNAITQWADADCLDVLEGASSDCGNQVEYLYTSGPDGIEALFRALPWTGPFFLENADGECISAEPDEDYVDLFAPGEEVDLLDFPLVVEVQE